MAHRDYGPGEITALGESIYKEQIQSQIGPVEKGTFVVIDIETGDYEIDAKATSPKSTRPMNRHLWTLTGREARLPGLSK